ncbi:Bet v1-like protein [Backusella circina FSU 941]|nr:Bet v1-like protein [Backusella circina FSU 941]
MTTDNEHSEAIKKALDLLKELTASLDGWKFSSETDNVKLYNKDVEGESLPIMRGDTILAGHKYTPQQLSTVATLPGCRTIWDQRFGESQIISRYSQYYALFWASMKAPWPVYWRDLCATSLREISDDLCYVVMTSVIDEKIPEKSGYVRANLAVSGWKFEKVEEGVAITYVNQIDLAGYIPPAFLRGLQQQIPLCAGKVVDYIQDYGYPPTAYQCDIEFNDEEFDHGKKMYTAKLDGVGQCSWYVSGTMYPNGFNVQVDGSNASVVKTPQENGDTDLTVKGIQGASTLKITKA